MRPECIARLLKAAKFPAGESAPDETKYTTWRMQADLICQGRFAELREWQLSELKSGSVRPVVEDRSVVEEDVPFYVSAKYALLLSLALLLLALVARHFINVNGKCGPTIEIFTETVVQQEPLTLDADELFEYKQPDIRKELRSKIKSSLINFFKNYHDITINRIEAHTDPIGRTDENKKLAEGRAHAIQSLLSEVVNDGAIHDKLKGEFSPKIDGPGPGTEDADYKIWDECFEEDYIGTPGNLIKSDERPLQDLNDGTRSWCSKSPAHIESGPYPACASIKLPRGNAERTARIADHFRDIVGCLAPMRHVVVNYQAVHDVGATQ